MSWDRDGNFAIKSFLTLVLIAAAYAMTTSLLAKGEELSRVAEKIIKKYGKTIWNIVSGMVIATVVAEEIGTHHVPEEIYEPVWTADDITHTEMDATHLAGTYVRILNNYTSVCSDEEGTSLESLPTQGTVKGAPPVDAGKQGKHVDGHNNSNPEKSQWPSGETGVRVHQDGNGNIHGYPVNPEQYLK